MRHIDFIGVGFQRCSTTWISDCLSAHPEIHLANVKELQFFNYNFEKGIEWYHKQFHPKEAESIAGEYTPDYIVDEVTVRRIAEYAPNAKLIVSLRNPFDRLISSYRLCLSQNAIPNVNIAEAIKILPRIYSDGLYAKHIKFLLEFYKTEQIFITTTEDIQRNPTKITKNLYEWLGVSADFKPPSLTRVTNVSVAPQLQTILNNSPTLRRIASSKYAAPASYAYRQINARQLTSGTRKSIAHGLHAAQCEQYNREVDSLSQLLSREFSHWKI